MDDNDNTAPEEENKSDAQESTPDEQQEEQAPDELTASLREESIKEQITPVGDLQMNISIESGKLKLPLGELLQMKPGNVLELGGDPSISVDLVVSGKCIGRGEFVRIGNRFGIRVLSLNES